MVPSELHIRSADGEQFVSYMYGMEMHCVSSEPQNTAPRDQFFDGGIIACDVSSLPPELQDHNQQHPRVSSWPMLPQLPSRETSTSHSIAIPISQFKKSPNETASKLCVEKLLPSQSHFPLGMTNGSNEILSAEMPIMGSEQAYETTPNFSMSAEQIHYSDRFKDGLIRPSHSLPSDDNCLHHHHPPRMPPRKEFPRGEWSVPGAIGPSSLETSPRSLNESLFSFRASNGSNTEEHLEKQKRRRENHNAVERRRRDLINGMIAQLSLLVSTNTAAERTPYNPSKMNKGEVLEAAVRQILALNRMILELTDLLAAHDPGNEFLVRNQSFFAGLVTSVPPIDFTGDGFQD